RPRRGAGEADGAHSGSGEHQRIRVGAARGRHRGRGGRVLCAVRGDHARSRHKQAAGPALPRQRRRAKGRCARDVLQGAVGAYSAGHSGRFAVPHDVGRADPRGGGKRSGMHWRSSVLLQTTAPKESLACAADVV
ncbi:hypothetical protein H4R21_005954, partial [Coemansia helicoidea]